MNGTAGSGHEGLFECIRRFGRRLRLGWHVWLRGLSREAAEDLIDGLDLGDRPISHRPRPPLLVCRPGLDPDGGRRGARITAADLDRLDAEFLRGGPVADRAVRSLCEDLWPDGRNER